MAYSRTLSIQLQIPTPIQPKKVGRSALLTQLQATRDKHRQERKSMLANLVVAQRPTTSRRRAQTIVKDSFTSTNVMTRRRYAMSGNFNIHENRKLELSGRSSEFTSRKLTTRDVNKLQDLIKKESYEQVAFKHILSTIETSNPGNKDFTHQFLSTVGLTASRRLAESPSPDQSTKPHTAGNYIRRPELHRDNSTTINRTKKPFSINTQVSSNFEERLYKYMEFLLLINLSNRVYRNLQLELERPLRFTVDRGNNAYLIRTVMARRFWWEESDKNPVFVWSQLKNSKLHARQFPMAKSYTHMAFPVKLVPQESTFLNKLDLAARQLSKNLALKLVSREDWRYISAELDGDKTKFINKIRKFQKWIRIVQSPFTDCIVTNHLKCNGLLGNKKALFLSMKLYYQLTNQQLWKYLPQTYHIKGADDPEFTKFTEAFNKHQSKVWIIKPGEFTNRGNGITIKSDLQEITRVINKQVGPGVRAKDRTFIVQHYLHEPLLYHRRKFDIRAYMMITCSNGIIKGYWYQQGYIRTSGYHFSLDELNNTYKHLTNDAIQKFSDNYGKYQKGNKLSYTEFQRYLESNNSKHSFTRDVYPVMKKIATDAIKATSLFLDSSKLQNNFEIFGLDFMIDNKFKTYLIEINTNPCLETGCPVLDRVIPSMVENAFRVGLDPIFPPPKTFPNSKKHYISENAIYHNSFELVFDELVDSKDIIQLFSENPFARELLQQMSLVEQDETVYNNDPPIVITPIDPTVTI